MKSVLIKTARLAATLALAAQAAAAPELDFEIRLGRFHSLYRKFYYQYYGCPDSAATPIDCRNSRAHIDTTLLAQTREAAKAVFWLGEPSK